MLSFDGGSSYRHVAERGGASSSALPWSWPCTSRQDRGRLERRSARDSAGRHSTPASRVFRERRGAIVPRAALWRRCGTLSVSIVFEKLRSALEAVGIPYFVTGSFASSAHGVPRSTNDIDIVIAPSRAQIERLLEHFPAAEYATDKEDAFDAFTRRALFNVVDYKNLWKVDFILKQQTPFDASRFSRRVVVEIAGVNLPTASPEDILLTKLWWAKLGESERQINDAAGIIQVQADQLDLDYVEKWVAVLELDSQWEAAKKRV